MSNISALACMFKVGDRVVYPTHGVGEITEIETQHIGGMELEVFVMNFAKDKMILRVPVKRAENSGLRPICTQDEVRKVVSVLQGRAKASRGMWSRRAQEYEGKINSGDLGAIAEVVRDLYKNVDDPDRSYSERNIYEAALARLVSEVAAVDNIEHAQALEFLIELLKEKAAA